MASFSSQFSNSFSIGGSTPVATLPGGSGKHYRRYSPPAWWGDEKKKKRVEALEERVAKVEKRIESKQLKLRKLVSLSAIEKALADIEALGKTLLALLSDLEEAKRSYENALDDEAAVIYAIYRTLH